MKKSKIFIFLLLLCMFVTGGIWQFGFVGGSNLLRGNLRSSQLNSVSDSVKTVNRNSTDKFYRNANAIDYSGVSFKPWDVKKASASVNKRERKPYTIMIYMNGSDLESENGAATDDIIEMLESGPNNDYVNLILFTGGTNRWQNDVIPENNCMIWEVANGQIYEITGVGLVNMGDAGTLASFIDFSISNFPAEKYGLIMWDHGGGSIAGYGHDEKFNNSNLTLLDMNYAFEKSALSKNKLEFLGFDSCLMATIEMAVVASDYAKYLIASEDLEPGEGWNYDFLLVLNDNPRLDGAELGKSIVDYFIDYYRGARDEILTLSVIDLSSVNQIMAAMGDLMNKCSSNLLIDRVSSFRTLAKKRSVTKTFGEGSPRDNECDMVDIGDMANKLSDLFPKETENVIMELEKAVKYNRHNSDTNLKGLSAYYIYGGKQIGDAALGTYAALNMNGDYTKYLNNFYSMLNVSDAVKRNRSSGQGNNSGNILQPDDITIRELTLWQPLYGKQGKFIMTGIQSDVNMESDEKITAIIHGLWPRIDGKNVCLYKINSSNGSLFYAIPSVLNGKDCDIVVLLSEKYPNGKILGVRQKDGIIIQKGFDKIEHGDKISFYYQERAFGGDKDSESISWHKSGELTVKDTLELEWSALNEEEIYYSLLMTDIRGNQYFSALKAAR